MRSVTCLALLASLAVGATASAAPAVRNPAAVARKPAAGDRKVARSASAPASDVSPVVSPGRDLRPALRAMNLKALNDGRHPLYTFEDGATLGLVTRGGAVISWYHLPARGSSEGVVLFDRAPDPRDKRRCTALVARGYLTLDFAVDCAALPPVR